MYESNYEVETCTGCERQTYLVNRTRMQCADCNCKRLHGMTLKERQLSQWKAQQIRAKEKQKNKPPQYKPKQKIPFFSEKGRERHTTLTATKKEIWEQAVKENGWVACEGCGRGDQRLENSHILSVAQRKDLENDKNNINLFCNSCHCKHESFEIPQLLQLKCFEKDMRYIYEKDETKFNKILFKLLDFVEANPQNKTAVSVLNRLERIETAE